MKRAEVYPQPDADRRAQVRPPAVRLSDEHGAATGVPVRGRSGAPVDEEVQPQEPPLALHAPHQLLDQQEVRVFQGEGRGAASWMEIKAAVSVSVAVALSSCFFFLSFFRFCWFVGFLSGSFGVFVLSDQVVIAVADVVFLLLVFL